MRISDDMENESSRAVLEQRPPRLRASSGDRGTRRTSPRADPASDHQWHPQGREEAASGRGRSPDDIRRSRADDHPQRRLRSDHEGSPRGAPSSSLGYRSGKYPPNRHEDRPRGDDYPDERYQRTKPFKPRGGPRSLEDIDFKYAGYIPVPVWLFPPGVKPPAVVIGRRGCNHARMQEVTGCCIQLRGRGISSPGTPGAGEKLHLFVRYDREDQLKAVEEMMWDIIDRALTEEGYSRNRRDGPSRRSRYDERQGELYEDRDRRHTTRDYYSTSPERRGHRSAPVSQSDRGSMAAPSRVTADVHTREDTKRAHTGEPSEGWSSRPRSRSYPHQNDGGLSRGGQEEDGIYHSATDSGGYHRAHPATRDQQESRSYTGEYRSRQRNEFNHDAYESKRRKPNSGSSPGGPTADGYREWEGQKRRRLPSSPNM